MGRVCPSKFSDQCRAHFVEQFFDLPAVFQRPFEQGHYRDGHIKATTPPLVGKGQEVVGVFLAAGTSAAVRPDTGLVHQGQRAFESRPAALEAFPEPALQRRIEFILLFHKREYSIGYMHTIAYAYYLSSKKTPANQTSARSSLPLPTPPPLRRCS